MEMEMTLAIIYSEIQQSDILRSLPLQELTKLASSGPGSFHVPFWSKDKIPELLTHLPII